MEPKRPKPATGPKRNTDNSRSQSTSTGQSAEKKSKAKNPLHPESPLSIAQANSLAGDSPDISFADIYSKKKSKPPLIPKSTPRSSSHLSEPTQLNCLSSLCKKFTSSRWFDRFILSAIMVNTVLMATEDPLAPPDPYRYAERTFLGIFFFEMVAKMLALGLGCGPGGYFNMAWNWLDFVVVLSAVLEEILFLLSDGEGGDDGGGLTVLRVIRVLRPLKTISSLPKLAAMINTMVNSIFPMFKAMLLLLMFCYIMAVFGNSFFRRELDFWTEEGSYMSFDNVFYAVLTIMQCVTLENWTEGALYPLQNSGRHYGCVLYFVVVILIGGFWLLNLAITVLTSEYEKARRQMEAEKYAEALNEPKDHEFGKANSLPVGETKIVVSQTVARTLIETSQTNSLHVGGVPPHNPHKHSSTSSSTSTPTTKSRAISTPPVITRGLPETEQVIVRRNDVPGMSPPVGSMRSNLDASIRDLNTSNLPQPPPLFRQQSEHDDLGPLKRFVGAKLSRIDECFESLSIVQKYHAFREEYTVPIIENPWFDTFIFSVIIANTVVLAMEEPFLDETTEQNLMFANEIFTFIFTIEMFLKQFSLGFKYFNENWNIFDMVIVWVSLAEKFPGVSGAMGDASALRALRVFRALRAVKAVKHLAAIQNIITVFEDASEEYVIFMMLLFLSIFIFVLTGMQVFSGSYEEGACAGSYEAGNWDSFYSSFVLIFRALTLDDWNTVAFGGVQCAKTNWTIFIFVSVWIVLGNFMLLNLFLAILIRSFERAKKARRYKKEEEKKRELEEQRQLEEELQQNLSSSNESSLNSSANNTPQQTPGGSKRTVHMPTPEQVARRIGSVADKVLYVLHEDPERRRNSSVQNEEDHEMEEHLREDVDKGIHRLGDMLMSPFLRCNVWMRRKLKLGVEADQQAKLDGIVRTGRASSAAFEMTKHIQAVAASGDKAFMTAQLQAHRESDVSGRHNELVDDVPVHGTSLYCFPHHNKFRIICHEVAHHKYFNNFIILCIILSSTCLALENPDTDAKTMEVLKATDKIFTYVFTFEMTTKVIALGFVKTETAYLKISWNQLDFLIVVSSLLDLLLTEISLEVDISFLKVIRLLRVLRPLRAVKRNKNMAMAVAAIIGSFMSVVNVAVLLAMIFGVFSILGLGLFGGTYWHCNDSGKVTKDACEGVFTVMYNHTFANDTVTKVHLEMERVWQNEDQNFDTFFNSFRTLFNVATLEGWYVIASRTTNIQEVGVAPDPDVVTKPYMFFFVIFICLANFMGLGLFVGVLCDHFSDESEHGNSLISEEQRLWIETQKSVLFSTAVVRARAPTNPFRKWCWNFIRTKRFNITVTFLIIGSVILTSMNYEGETEAYVRSLAFVNTIFTVFFALEAFFKLVGDGPKIYFKRLSCCFDFFLMAGSVSDDCFDIARGNANILFVLRIFRVFRVSRLLRLLGPNSSTRELMKIIVYSLPSVWNIAALLFMLFFTYAILGTALFGDTNYDDGVGDWYNPNMGSNPGQYSPGVNPNANFRHFGTALTTLFRISTGENWQYLMEDCGRDNSYNSNLMTTFYFFTFIIICQYITLNLFVAVLLENFNVVKKETKEQEVFKDEMQKFVEVWAVYDPDATQFISVHQLPFIVTSLNKPLGLGKKATQKDIERLLWECDIPIYRFIETREDGEVEKSNKVYYKDVLFRLCKHGFGKGRAEAMSHSQDAQPKNPALELLRKERLIFSTREYIAVSKICKVIVRRQGKSLGDSFLDVIMTAAKIKQRELANEALGEMFDDQPKKKRDALSNLISRLAHQMR
ncbi:hypothetical protein TrLO_g3687 [Triparma laevis f. longispina]|uniref:Uncharacterized protein n=1 Tax=Triparma laevis f. longispina TaxID=1714387 RepID=A0A9W7FIW8_9STRA|nr:hypothetical protein TrLO_g3687 [Triparma laevis f. longispina]